MTFRFVLRVLTALLMVLGSIPPAEAFWGGLTAEQEAECRGRAEDKLNSFSAKQEYEFCRRTIKDEYRERERRSRLIAKKQQDKEKITSRMNQVCKQYFQDEAQQLLDEKEKNYPYYQSESDVFWQHVKDIGVYKGSSVPFTKYPQELIDEFNAMRWYKDFGERDDELSRRFAQKVGTVGVWRVQVGTPTDHYRLSSCDFRSEFSILFLEERDL